MGYWVFENELTELDKVPKGQENLSIIKTRTIPAIINTLQHSILDKTNFLLRIWNNDTRASLTVEFASSNRIEEWEYEVYQKWIYPYWRSEKYFFYPSSKNPMGRYLIILRSLVSGSVVPYWIHQWFNWDWNTTEFQKGIVNNRWCIRIKREEIEMVFNALNLGSKIQVI